MEIEHQSKNNFSPKHGIKNVKRSKQHHYLYVLVLVLVCASVYFNSLSNDFAYDDYSTIVENQYLKDLTNYFSSFFNRSYFRIAGAEASYRPITTLSYFLIYATCQLNPFCYHLASLLVHIGNVLLIYLLMNLIQKNTTASILAALFFACHPALTEAVNCIDFNDDPLATLFFLLSLIFYIRLKAEYVTSNIGGYSLALLFYLLGLLSKEMAITLPAIILLSDLTLVETGADHTVSQRFVQNIRLKKFYYMGYILVSLFYLGLRFALLTNPAASTPFSNGPFLERIIYLPNHIFNYIKIVLWPLKLNADYIYSYPQHFFEVTNLVAVLVVACLVVLSVLIYQSRKIIFFGIWWFLITLSPVWNVIEIYNPVAERYLYLPVIGFCIAVAAFLANLLQRTFQQNSKIQQFAQFAIVFLVLIGYSTITIARNKDWSDSFRLWTAALKLSPNNAKAQSYLGLALAKQGQTDEASAHYQRALQINPEYTEAHNNFGGELLKQGKTDEAGAHFTEALRLNPNLAETHNNMGIVLVQKGKIEAAIFHFKQALRINPYFEMADANLKRALNIQNNWEAETSRIQDALKADPENPVLFYEMGNSFLGRDQLSQAIGQFEKALSIHPDFTPALNNLALAYAADKQYDRALEAFKKMAEFHPDNASIYYNVAAVYALQNNGEESILWLKKAIDKGYQNWEFIKTDKDLENIRDLAGYRELVKGH